MKTTIVRTECDVLTSDDLPSNGDEASFETELEWIVTDGYSRIILCEPGEPSRSRASSAGGALDA